MGDWLFIAASALLNRIRGDKSILGIGKSLWYAAPVIGLLGFLLAGLTVAQGAALAGVYLAWALPPWGRWFGLGRAPLPDRAASWFEVLIERLSTRIHGRFLLRHAVLVPLLPIFAYWSVPWALAGLALPFLFTATYEVFWRLYDNRAWLEARGLAPRGGPTYAPTAWAEGAVGLLWGVYGAFGHTL